MIGDIYYSGVVDSVSRMLANKYIWDLLLFLSDYVNFIYKCKVIRSLNFVSMIIIL